MENTKLQTINTNNQNPISILKTLNNLVKIKEFDKIGHLVIPICNKHAVLSGIDKEIDQFTKEEIAKYTAIHLKNLTIEEIEMAFQNERFNLYDLKTKHYNFFSIDYYTEIIQKYKVWKQNEMTKHNIQINQSLLPEQSNSTIEKNNKQIRIEFIKYIFSEIKNKKIEYIEEAFTLYDDFIDHKLIVISDQEKKDLYQVMYNKTIKKTESEISTAFKKSLRSQLKSFLNDLQINKNKNEYVKNRCKAYLVSKKIDSFLNVESIFKKMNL